MVVWKREEGEMKVSKLIPHFFAPSKSWVEFDSRHGENEDDLFALFQDVEDRTDSTQEAHKKKDTDEMLVMKTVTSKLVDPTHRGKNVGARMSLATDEFLEFLIGDEKDKHESLGKKGMKMISRMLRR